MRRYTTPTITLEIEGIDLTDYYYEVSIRQHCVLVTVTDADCEATTDGCTLSFTLSQEDTGKFRYDNKWADIQVRYVDANDVAGATEIKRIPIQTVLKEGVLEYVSD